MSQTLCSELSTLWKNRYIPRTSPGYISLNLNTLFPLRPYQEEAFARFIYYRNSYIEKESHSHLLLHMATGSGKTLIMAGLILYLYTEGYRNFLYFVNNTNIIDKTRSNFLEKSSIKYLFNSIVNFEGTSVNIREVPNFQISTLNDINISFSTIQGLHSRLNSPRENSLTYDDFSEKEIILFSDEAHHLNVDTRNGKKLTSEEEEEKVSWEGTVQKIFNANPKNILLEFTATADLGNPDIANKYEKKILFDYPLKQFRIDGYSKEVKVLQSDIDHLDRGIQAILLSQLRRKVFEKNHLLIKPVVLFKSHTIKESQDYQSHFIQRIKTLKATDIDSIKTRSSDSTIKNLFKYFSLNRITSENLVSELKEDFSEEKLISVNSKEESEEKQIKVNTLEDPKNEIRAVFAVDKLNEGWDVLNLFDIVRLYDTRDAKAGKPGKTTMSEAQLIGRGARYCPFQLSPDQSPYLRKFDQNLENEMRICEELYYHSAYNPKYIQELNQALVEIGIKPPVSRECPFRVKNSFKKKPFFSSGLVYLNEQQKYNRSDIYSLKSTIIQSTHKYSLRTGISKTQILLDRQHQEALEVSSQVFDLLSFGSNVIRTAINRLPFYEFSNLKALLPNLSSINEFITSTNYLGSIKVEITGLPAQLQSLSQDEKLETSIKVLDEISKIISSEKIEYQGTKEFKPNLLKDLISDKILNFAFNEEGDQEFGHSMKTSSETAYYLNLDNKDWYIFDDCFGTSEEKLFIKYLDSMISKIKKIFDEVYLVRNERFIRLFNFSDGRAFEPDFILYLVKHDPKTSVYFQSFIEPKGSQFFTQDEWKEKFLLSLKSECRVIQLHSNEHFTIWGMPFYNEAQKKVDFMKSFEELLNA